MKTAICPKCFATASEAQWVYHCQNSECELTFTAVKKQAKTAKCPACGSGLTIACCPLCGYTLCEDDADSATLSVSLVGAQGCGKSHYLSVLLNEIKRQVGKAYSCALYPLGGDETIKLYDREYYQPLYVHGHCLSVTDQADISPLMYTLVFNDDRAARNIGLTFYDACGSNFESITAMTSLNRSIYHSGGIIFLIDPTQLSGVREWQSTRGGKICDVDPIALLSRTVHLIRAGMGQVNLTHKIEVPIAICLTKLDMIEPLLDDSSFLLGPSRHLRKPGFDNMDFEACSLETQSLIEYWGGGEIISQITSQFSTFGFFAISSLGQEPDNSTVHHIAPHRVLDPLLWLLWKKKLLK